ncbi:FtsX-like permease family protein [Alteromonas sediminis]|uniref:FtsX-like permease family protein n=1 Tax=Alteromonas sediminis TaxID=2259342 RepID=A0A3N5Z9E0_9ALTE|nr:FtsX-like permease family protein [Alteromonas sediminis]RPJ65828.1 FtsX-like permease family protein [Alteromonas sediminis]
MRIYINAFKQGIARIFTLPRLSLPLITTLGLTLAAVLTVVSVANVLLFKPLPDINEKDLYQVELSMELNEGFNVPFFSDPRRVASLKKHYGDELSWGHVSASDTQVEVGGTAITVMQYNAVSGSPETLGLALLQGLGTDAGNTEEGVWISESLWKSSYASTTDLSKQTVRLEGREFPILGVIENFTSISLENIDDQLTEQVWRFRDLDKTLETPDSIAMSMGSMTFVRGTFDAIPKAKDLETWFVDYVNSDIAIDQARQFLLSKPVSGELTSYRDAFIGDSQRLVFLLLTAMVCLLTMACLNLLNMFIAHYQSRTKEFSIQICMGSSVAKLRGLIFTENMPMFLMATVLGLITTGWLIKILPTLAGDNLPLLDQISLTTGSVSIGFAIILFINLIFAAIALLNVDKKALTESLNSSGKGTPAQQKQTINKLLMVIQLTLACVLLTSAIASVKDSYQQVYSDLGYSMPNAYEVSMQFSDEEWAASLNDFEQYRGSELQQLRRDFTQRLSATGGEIIDTTTLPLTANVLMNAFPDPDTGDTMMVRPMLWAPGLLSTFEIDVLAGRNLTPEDVDLPNILITKSFAMERVGDSNWENAVNTELKMGQEESDIFTIVGIVEDINPLPSGTIFVDAPEIYFSAPVAMTINQLSAVVLMPEGEQLDLEKLVPLVKGVDPRLGELQVASMQQRWQSVTQATRLNMYVVMGLAALTLTLAAIGVSGLSQMTAGQKRYELAVRMATGAKQRALLTLLLRDSVWMLVIGLGLGLAAAVTAYQYLLNMFETAPAFDWTATAGINFLLAAVMILSIAIPGWAVIRKDPMRALREL